MVGDSNTVAFRQTAYIHLRAVVQRQLAEGKGAICGVKLDLEGPHLRGRISRRDRIAVAPVIRIVRYFKRDTLGCKVSIIQRAFLIIVDVGEVKVLLDLLLQLAGDAIVDIRAMGRAAADIILDLILSLAGDRSGDRPRCCQKVRMVGVLRGKRAGCSFMRAEALATLTAAGGIKRLFVGKLVAVGLLAVLGLVFHRGDACRESSLILELILLCITARREGVGKAGGSRRYSYRCLCGIGSILPLTILLLPYVPLDIAFDRCTVIKSILYNIAVQVRAGRVLYSDDPVDAVVCGIVCALFFCNKTVQRNGTIGLFVAVIGSCGVLEL